MSHRRPPRERVYLERQRQRTSSDSTRARIAPVRVQCGRTERSRRRRVATHSGEFGSANKELEEGLSKYTTCTVGAERPKRATAPEAPPCAARSPPTRRDQAGPRRTGSSSRRSSSSRTSRSRPSRQRQDRPATTRPLEFVDLETSTPSSARRHRSSAEGRVALESVFRASFNANEKLATPAARPLISRRQPVQPRPRARPSSSGRHGPLPSLGLTNRGRLAVLTTASTAAPTSTQLASRSRRHPARAAPRHMNRPPAAPHGSATETRQGDLRMSHERPRRRPVAPGSSQVYRRAPRRPAPL